VKAHPVCPWLPCHGHGQVQEPYGFAGYLYLGASVVAAQFVIQVFGTQFLRNSQVLAGLGLGYIAAALATHTPPTVTLTPPTDTPTSLHYVSYSGRHPSLGFFTLPLLSPSPYPLSVYPPLLLPLLTCFVITTVETLGDVVATAEASKLKESDAPGEDLASRIQGGLLADGVSSTLASLFNGLPTTTMSQNNGISR